jgi:glycosyltransferase involved in cell wall biosynthesis
MRISAALIVKNEERTLGRCLASIREHVDEIVIVDTGSTDKTKAVARQFTDRIYDFPWRRDFAAARQFGFDRASGDWIFWLDADDVVMNADHIRPSALSADPEVKAIFWKYIVGRDQYGNSTSEFWRERCVRNDGFHRWAGRVHEVLVPRAPCATLRNHDILVFHLREVRPDRSPTRNLEILKEELRRTRYRPEPRLLLCLANEYADLGQVDLAIDFLQRYARVSWWDEEKYFALLRLADLLRQRRRLSEAVDAALAALKTSPFWPNAYFSLGETYYHLRDWPRVVHWIDLGRQLPAPETICIVDPRSFRYNWMIHYTNALYHLGKPQEALEWSDRALSICPGETWHIVNWHFFSECLRTRELEQRGAAIPARNGGLPTIFWQAPLFDPSGYADEARQYVLALARSGMRVRAVPCFHWCSDRVTLSAADAETLYRVIRTPAARPGENVVSVCHMTADSFHRIPGALLHVGRTMCETDRIPAWWVELCNSMDEIWVPCYFNVETFAASGVIREKLVRMPPAIDIERFQSDAQPLPIPGRRAFNFLSVFEWSRRKGWDILLRAFAEEFKPNEDVSLLVKVGITGGRRVEQFREEATNLLRQQGHSRGLPVNVTLYQANLAAEQMPGLYRAADAFVLPSRGEGWSRPLMEAMLVGLPCIATRWSGQLDFMNDANSWLVDCDVVPVPEEAAREAPIYRGHYWAEPSVPHLRRLMREVFEKRAAAGEKARAGQHEIASNYSQHAVAALIGRHLSEVLAR